MTSSLLKIVHIDKFENQPYMILKDVFIHHNKNIMFCNRQPSKSIYTHIWGKKLLRGGKKLLTYRPPFLPCGTYEQKQRLWFGFEDGYSCKITFDY